MLFGKEPSKVEVVNDVDRNLINFYSVIKNNINNFLEMFDTYLVSRDEFVYLKDLLEDDLSDIMLAYKFYYINKNSFGGDMTSFNSYWRDKPYINDNALKLLKKAHQRLKSVWIENMDYKKLIEKFDNPKSFIYLDPPYHETNNGSYSNKNIDFGELKELLSEAKGKWLLTVNDNEYTRELFGEFNIIKKDVQYNMSKDSKGRGKFGELIIMNYKN